MTGFLPFIVAFIFGLVVYRLTGSPAVGQAAGLFALSATVLATGSIRLSGLEFDGSAARVAGVGIGVMGLFRLLVELQHGAGAADILAP